MALRVLCIDDDTRLFELLASYLGPNGIVLEHALDGPRGLVAVDRGDFDAVLLDLMMPGMDGLEVCRRLRAKSQVPIIMLTARGDEADRIVGLELGADDYLPKPFSPRELLARLRAVLRRTQPQGEAARLRVGAIGLDRESRSVFLGEKNVSVTGLEFDLLWALALRPGRVVARETLLHAAGRSDVTVTDRTVDVHISHLRRKLGDDPRAPRLVKTVRGIGYVLARDEPGNDNTP